MSQYKVKCTNQGFSLLELMIVLTIMAILAALAIPNYQLYIKKAKFSQIITHITPYKTAVEVCAQLLGGLANSEGNCGTAGQNEIPADFIGSADGKNYVGSIRVSYAAPNVLITGTAQNLGEAYNYILKGQYGADGAIHWQVDAGSSCLKEGLCRN